MTVAINEIICGDCFEVMKDIPDKSVDLIILDPPYGFGIDAWDNFTKQDINNSLLELERVLSINGFFALFGQIPHIIEWHNNIKLNFREHIVWAKRLRNPSIRLSRTHEEIFIYSKKNAQFYNTKGSYEDVQLPGLLYGAVNLESVKRYISSLRTEIKRGSLSIRTEKGRSLPVYDRFPSSGSRCPEIVNYSNLWSFLPENSASKGNAIKHACVKPVLLIQRLITLLSQEDALILDPFAGSCTTAVACLKTNRNFICIEKEEQYCKIGKDRIAMTQKELL